MLCHDCGSFDYGIFYKEDCPDCPGERVLTLRAADGKVYAYRQGNAEIGKNNQEKRKSELTAT